MTSLGHGLGRALKKVFGSRNARVVKKMAARIPQINSHEEWAKGLSQEDMAAQTASWKEEVKAGRKLDEILPQAFAMVREAAVRTLGLRHYDVQLVGGMVLHNSGIAEMATGEGKTLVATLPAYLNALENTVFVVTVNDYLARRDAEWMQPVYEYLGLQVGAIQSNMSPQERHPIYASDIVYGTNNEFGFDYLRDNMKSRLDDQVQKVLSYAIIDEVDSILIDEARTPLIISGPAQGDAEKYRVGMAAARKLKPDEHVELKEKEKQAILTEDGIVEAQKLLSIDDFYSSAAHMEWPHILEQCLRALHLYQLDTDYVVKDGRVVIVDEFTGRLMDGRRWGDGLHQAVEAKEGLRPKAENQTLATITFQNYFRMFNKLAGMTGTALTEAGEFANIYDLDVVAIPTNKPIARKDEADVIYLEEGDKWKAIVDEIEEVRDNGQPVLVGTTSIENSEKISNALNRRGIRHEVLNAKQHEREADIVAQAGRKGAVTVATNMAGRGTDIVLGGNVEGLLREELQRRKIDPETQEAEVEAVRAELEQACKAEKQEVLGAGGLYVLGTERHESRRIDNQLRGRSGRQGDPGRTRFFLSLDDPLMRRFYKDWVKNFLSRAGMGSGEPVESRMVSNAIRKAQKKVENYHFEIRKNLLEYDEVMDKQRHLIYEHRQEALNAEGLDERIFAMFDEVLGATLETYRGDGRDIPTDFEAIQVWAQRKWASELTLEQLQEAGDEGMYELLMGEVRELYAKREEEFGAELMRELERFLMLNAIDSKWKEHLYTMDALRAGIGLRGYAQVDPKTEYKREGLERFQELLFSVADEVTGYILRMQLKARDDEALERNYAGARASHPNFSATGGPVAAAGGAAQQRPQQRPKQRVAVGYTPPQNAAQRETQRMKDRQAQEEAAAKEAEAAEQAAATTSTATDSQGDAYAKVGRNEPCPCGSGKKFKQCHGKA
ncbi:MAG: preprotein translocase subunit SecA [Planctomycetes bacterium]|nr:preprotein translocase subunit SecA [Planctomycetota bacterium]